MGKSAVTNWQLASALLEKLVLQNDVCWQRILQIWVIMNSCGVKRLNFGVKYYPAYGQSFYFWRERGVCRWLFICFEVDFILVSYCVWGISCSKVSEVCLHVCLIWNFAVLKSVVKLKMINAHGPLTESSVLLTESSDIPAVIYIVELYGPFVKSYYYFITLY